MLYDTELMMRQRGFAVGNLATVHCHEHVRPKHKRSRDFASSWDKTLADIRSFPEDWLR